MRLRCATGVALLVASTAVSGCGQAEQVMRKLDVKDAAAWIEDAPAVRATLSIEAEPGALSALVRDHGDVAGVSGLPLDDAILGQIVAGARIVVVGAPGGSVSAAGTAGTGTASTAVTVQAGGANLVELVSGGGDLHARIDPAHVLAYLPAGSPFAGRDPFGLAIVLDLVAPGTGDLLRGRWVAVNAEAAGRWAGPRLGGLFANGEQVMPAVARGFETVVRRAAIREDPGDPGHTILTITGEDLRAVVGDRAPADLPATIALDAYTADGRLERLSIDLGQFAEGREAKDAGAPEPVRLVVRLEEVQPVRAPSGARRLDPAELPTLAELSRRMQRWTEPP